MYLLKTRQPSAIWFGTTIEALTLAVVLASTNTHVDASRQVVPVVVHRAQHVQTEKLCKVIGIKPTQLMSGRTNPGCDDLRSVAGKPRVTSQLHLEAPRELLA
jgi:type IV secretory pathway TrbF-like protein